MKKREELKAARNGKHVPIAVKIAPDLENDEILRCVDTLIANGIDGVICTNTTIGRKGVEGSIMPTKRAVSRVRLCGNVLPKWFASLRIMSRGLFRSLLRAV